jgi:hypothetical protein
MTDKKLVPVWQPDGRILMQEIDEGDNAKMREDAESPRPQAPTETTAPKTKPRRKPRKDKHGQP